jgi:hypothetical protein
MLQQLVLLVLSCKCNCTSRAFTWKSANYGGAVEVVYTVEIDKKEMRLKHL